MAIKPTKPTVPTAPSRSNPSTFSTLADAFVAFFSPFASYLDNIATFVDETADDVAINAVLPAAQLWATATSYSLNDVVEESGLYYKAIVAHTSGTFVTDRDTNGYWELIGAERFDVNANTLVATAGTGNDYTITAAETITTYATGQRFLIRADRANTGASTLNVDSVGATAIQRYDSAGVLQDLVADEIQQGEIHQVTYDGTRFVLISLPLREVTKVIGLVPIVTKTASAASTLDFTEFDSDIYDGYRLACKDITLAGSLYLRFSTDGGSSFVSTSNYAWVNRTTVLTGTTLTVGSSLGADTEIFFCPDGSAGNLVLEFSRPDVTYDKTVTWSGTYNPSGGGTFQTAINGNGMLDNGSACDAIRILPNSGTFDGEFTLYGYRKPS